jgi:hypothetical protein
MPALTPESIQVHHLLSEGEGIDWKGYKMTRNCFPGQTIRHDGLLIEHDETRRFMTGDSFADFGIDDYCSYNLNFLGKDEPGYEQRFRLLVKLKPDLLVAFPPESYSAPALRLGCHCVRAEGVVSSL